jgi:hypothetical protein
MVERERELSKFRLHATFVLYPRRASSVWEVGILRMDGGEVVPQTGLDLRAGIDLRTVVTTAAATGYQQRHERAIADVTKRASV